MEVGVKKSPTARDSVQDSEFTFLKSLYLSNPSNAEAICMRLSVSKYPAGGSARSMFMQRLK